MADPDRLKRGALGTAFVAAFLLPTEAAYTLVFYLALLAAYAPLPQPLKSKSLFASFSSEKEEKLPLDQSIERSFVLFLKKKNQKDFYSLGGFGLAVLLVGWSGLTLVWGEGTGRRAWQFGVGAAVTAGFLGAGFDVLRKPGAAKLLALCCAGNACLSLGLGAPALLQGARILGWGVTRQPILGGSVMAAGCLSALALAAADTTRRAVWLGATLPMLAFILAMDSRGALLGFLAGLCALAWAFRRRIGRRGALGAACLVALLATVMLAVPALRHELVAAWLSRGDSHRLFIWRDTVRAIAVRPLLGHGLAALLPFSPTGFPHSLYLSLLFYSGVVGLLLFLGVLAACAACVARAQIGVRRVCVAALLANALVAGLTDFGQVTKPGPLWIILWLPVLLALRLTPGPGEAAPALPAQAISRQPRDAA